MQVFELHVILQDVDVRPSFRQKASDEEYLQAPRHRIAGGRLLARRGEVASEDVGHRRERQVAVHRVKQGAELVLLDPPVNAGTDLLVAQVLRRDAKDALREFGGEVQHPGQPRRLRIIPRGTSVALVAGRDLAPEGLRLGDPAPAEVVEHLVGDSQEAHVVRLADQVQHRLPVSPAALRAVLPGRLPFLQHVLHLLVGQEVAEAVGDGLDELLLLHEERTDIRGRHFFRVVHADVPDDLLLLNDIGVQIPGRLLEVRRPVFLTLECDRGPAGLGELPSRRDRLDDAPADRVDVRVGILQASLDGVETRELLGALRECLQQSNRRLSLLFHGGSPRGHFRRPP